MAKFLLISQKKYRQWGLALVILSLPVPLYAQVPAIPSPAPVAAQPTKNADDAPPDEMDTGPTLHSLFYTSDEIALIMQAAKAYQHFKMASSSEAQSQAKDFLSQLEEAKKSAQFEKNFEYPQFFLESLVYHTPEDWFLQVNGQKLAPDKREKFGLKVISVDDEKVIFEWTPLNMQLVNDTWSKMHNDEIAVNRKAATVTFALRSNQTFSSYLMRVVEGKVRPVRIDNVDEVNDKSSKDKKLPGGIGGMNFSSPISRMPNPLGAKP